MKHFDISLRSKNHVMLVALRLMPAIFMTLAANLVHASDFTPGQVYVLRNPNSNKVLDVAGGQTQDGANVAIWTANGTPAQDWRVNLNANNTYTLVNTNSGKALDVAWAGTSDGTNVQIASLNGGGAQQWRINPNSNGSYTLTNVNSNKVLDVAGAERADGTNVAIWSSNGTPAQQWIFQANVESNPTIKVMTFNVRTEYANDPGERNWTQRRDKLVEVIRAQGPSLLGMQEATSDQHDYIRNHLGSDWASSPQKRIIFRKDQYTLLKAGVIELGTDQWEPRLAEWLKLQRLTDGKVFTFASTHWGVDIASEQNAANILRARMHEINDEWSLPTILLGDLNVHPDWAPLPTLLSNRLTSFYSGNTFNNWNVEPQEQFDYIVGSKVSATHCVLDKSRPGGIIPSDHFPIVCDLLLQ